MGNSRGASVRHDVIAQDVVRTIQERAWHNEYGSLPLPAVLGEETRHAILAVVPAPSSARILRAVNATIGNFVTRTMLPTEVESFVGGETESFPDALTHPAVVALALSGMTPERRSIVSDRR